MKRDAAVGENVLKISIWLLLFGINASTFSVAMARRLNAYHMNPDILSVYLTGNYMNCHNYYFHAKTLKTLQ